MTTRVLLAEDSSAQRALIKEALSKDPGIDVAATAENGGEALELLERADIDIVLLDVEMPIMDGIETLRRIRESRPALPVLMFSALTQRGAPKTIEALMTGADDYVGKPSDMGNLSAAATYIVETVAPKIKRLAAQREMPLSREPAPVSAESVSAPGPKPTSGLPAEIIGISASTGGPQAVGAALKQLPTDFGAPIVVVQHIIASFTDALAERLGAEARLPVTVAKDGDALTAGVWIAPGDVHLAVEPSGDRWACRISSDAPENDCRPSADVLFRSMAAAAGPRALALVMSGMGNDGVAGCRAVRDAGGRILVQDGDTSRAWSTPGALVKEGLADAEIRLDDIGAELVRRAATGASTGA